jgi:hypothetical protein
VQAEKSIASQAMEGELDPQQFMDRKSVEEWAYGTKATKVAANRATGQ